MYHWDTIKKFPHANYRVTAPWSHLERMIKDYQDDQGLILCPDFQRGHVWTEEQQIRFVEFALKGPDSGLEIYLNHPNWMHFSRKTKYNEFVLVDGLQRLTAVLKFLGNEIPAYGCWRKDYTGYAHIPVDHHFNINIASLPTKAEVLQWYIDFNAGGTPHDPLEIERVKKLLEEERDAS